MLALLRLLARLERHSVRVGERWVPVVDGLDPVLFRGRRHRLIVLFDPDHSHFPRQDGRRLVRPVPGHCRWCLLKAVLRSRLTFRLLRVIVWTGLQC